MATTQNTFTGDGSTTNYSFTFEYIKEADVKATLDGTATTAFTLANATTLSFTTAPANGVAIRIFRDTDIDSLKATFFPGSAIKAEDLNDNFTQNNFAVQEADFNVDTANATANTAKTNSETAIATANTADTNASAAVATANTADTNASAAVATANTASTNASNAVTTANAASTTANAADANATTALNNSRESDGQGGFTTAIAKANTAITTANTASTNASSAVTTANSASTTANSALTTANTASSDASTAISTANAASAAVSNAVLFDLIANVAAIPGSPSNDDYIEIGDSTGIESFTPLSGLPSGFVGASGLTVRLRYDGTNTTWVWMSYFANDSETRYVAIGNPNPVYYANQAAFPSATDYHGGIAHSHADGAMYYAHGGNWIKMASDSDVSANTSSIATNTTNIGTNTTDIATNTTNIGTKMPIAGGTFSGNVEISTGIDLNTDGSAYFGGNLGVGTSSPFTTLHSSKSITGGSPASSGTTDANAFARLQGGSVGLDFGGTSAGLQWLQPRDVNNFATNYGLSLCPNGGKVGIGTTSGAGKLTVQDSSLPKIQSNFNGTKHMELGVGGSGCGFAMSTGHFMTFNHQPYADRGTDNNLTERLRIGSSGQLGLGGANYGTSGQVITSNGSGSAPTWQDAGGGAWNLVSTVTASAAATVTFQGDLDSTYKQYVLIVSELTSDDNTSSEPRLNFMVGATELTDSNYDTNGMRKELTSSTINGVGYNNQAYGRLFLGPYRSSTLAGHFGTLEIWLNGGRNSTNHAASFRHDAYESATNSRIGNGIVTYANASAQAVDGVRISMSSGNLSGTFKLYGLS